MRLSSKGLVWLNFSPLVVGAIVGISLIYLSISNTPSGIALEDLALGKETSSYWAKVNDFRVHCSDLDDAHHCFSGFKKAVGDGGDKVLWLGNSQLHAINQMKHGEKTAVEILHRKLRKDSKYLMTFSQPNANLQEHYLLFEYIINRMSVNTLLLPVVFDDMRETGIRQTLVDILKNKEVFKRLNKTKVGGKITAIHGDRDLSGNINNALNATIQEKLELYLNTKLSKVWTVWGKRAELRGDLLVNLYFFRNWLFGISASSIRPVIPSRYIMNINALEAILQAANQKRIKVLLYIAPLRSDVKIPYNINSYEKFKTEIELIAKDKGVVFRDFESVVPNKYWGKKDSTTFDSSPEIDFMHFQAGGHVEFSNSIYEAL